MTHELIQQPNYIIDRLYGKLEVNQNDLVLYQTPEMSRSRNISLSSQPPQLLNTGMCDTRFNHSVGVGHLAKVVVEQDEFKFLIKDLPPAALVHDVGHPPFSHSSDYFLQKVIGKDHEEMVSEYFDGTQLAMVINAQGGNIDTIIKLVEGKMPPYSDILHGTIDIDNLDNVLRYSLGVGLIDSPTYSPESIARSLTLRDNHLVFMPGVEDNIRAWEATRKVVYDYVDAPFNKSLSMMIFRGLGFAYEEGELGRNFFYMTDVQALDYLKNECNPNTRQLFENIEAWQIYQPVYEFTTVNPSQKAKEIIENRDNRIGLANDIADEIGVEPQHVCVYVGKSKGVRNIHIPILDEEGNSSIPQPENDQKWMACVYVHPTALEKIDAIHTMMFSILTPGIDNSGNSASASTV